MRTYPDFLRHEIIGAMPGNCTELHSFLISDLYGDGEECFFTGGREGLFWYAPNGERKGVICPTGFFHVGLASADMDGDGKKEIYAALQDMHTGVFQIVRYTPGNRLEEPWAYHVIDPYCSGNAHDIAFFDVDGDSRSEMVTVGAYSKTPGLFIYKFDDIDHPRRYQIMEGHLTEGIRCADLDHDGKIEIVSGPDYYHMPESGCYSGLWERRVYAESFRDMCRMDLADITGNGTFDIIAVESEYCDGQFSWFENRLAEEGRFIEHRIGECMVFAHSIEAVKEDGGLSVMIAEMSEGGWWQPYNVDAHVFLYRTMDMGKTWSNKLLHYGQGTHQARYLDVDGDGVREVVGKTWQHPIIQTFRKTEKPDVITSFGHRFLDRDKSEVATDIMACDLTGDGLEDVACGRWWYQAPDFTKRQIPYINQVIAAYDVDGSGRKQLICTLKNPHVMNDPYHSLSSELVLLRLLDAGSNRWEMECIGRGSGAWPHGIAIGRIDGFEGIVLALAYHDSDDGTHFPPEIFERKAPNEPWERRVIADIHGHEEIIFCDVDMDGTMDMVIGGVWLKNNLDKTFTPHPFAGDMDVSRVRALDMNGNGLTDLLVVDETCDYKTKTVPFGELAWFENPGQIGAPWKKHVIDAIRSGHSLEAADLDGDGEVEIIAAEHIPFSPYRTRSRLMVYRRLDKTGTRFARFVLDDRFEHHDGCKILHLKNGQPAIISHGWVDSQFVHIWERK